MVTQTLDTILSDTQSVPCWFHSYLEVFNMRKSRNYWSAKHLKVFFHLPMTSNLKFYTKVRTRSSVFFFTILDYLI